jgi:hypothetical protein
MKPFTLQVVKFSCTNEEHFETIRDLIIYKMEGGLYINNIIENIASDFLKSMLVDDGLSIVQSKSYWRRASTQEHRIPFGGENHFKVHCVLMARERARQNKYKHLHLEMLFYEVKADRVILGF